MRVIPECFKDFCTQLGIIPLHRFLVSEENFSPTPASKYSNGRLSLSRSTIQTLLHPWCWMRLQREPCKRLSFVFVISWFTSRTERSTRFRCWIFFSASRCCARINRANTPNPISNAATTRRIQSSCGLGVKICSATPASRKTRTSIEDSNSQKKTPRTTAIGITWENRRLCRFSTVTKCLLCSNRLQKD